MQKYEIDEQLAQDIAKLYGFCIVEIEENACTEFPSQEDYDLEASANRIFRFLSNRKVVR